MNAYIVILFDSNLSPCIYDHSTCPYSSSQFGKALELPHGSCILLEKGSAFMQPPRSYVLRTYFWPTSNVASSDCFNNSLTTEYSVNG